MGMGRVFAWALGRSDQRDWCERRVVSHGWPSRTDSCCEGAGRAAALNMARPFGRRRCTICHRRVVWASRHEFRLAATCPTIQRRDHPSLLHALGCLTSMACCSRNAAGGRAFQPAVEGCWKDYSSRRGTLCQFLSGCRTIEDNRLRIMDVASWNNVGASASTRLK